MADPHEHDWRVNPNEVLASNPPKFIIVCAICGEKTYRSSVRQSPYQGSDPKTWPHAKF